MKCLIVFLTLLASTTAVRGDGYTYIPESGLYQWSDGTLWTRAFIPGTSYYSCGRCYSSPGYYQYSYHSSGYKSPAAQAYVPDDDATIIAKAVAARDAVRNRITESTYRHQNLIQSIQKANLDASLGGLPALNSYGSTLYGGAYNSVLAGTFGVNTSTIYGYNQSLAQTINPFAVNLDQYFLAAAQLAQGSQEAAREANTQFNSSVNLAADRAAGLSAIAARRDAVVAFARLLDGPPTQTNSTYQFTIGPAGKITAQPQPGTPTVQNAPVDLQAKWNASAQKCSVCHFGNRKEGGFSVDSFPSMDKTAASAVIARLLLPRVDPKHMPKEAESLSADEISAWIQVMQQAADRPQAMPKLK